MKQKLVLCLTLLSLTLAALACQFPGQDTPTPTLPEPTEETPVTPTEPTPALPVFPNPVIFNFSFFTPTKGWAVTQDGYNLLITVDGGATWYDATPADLSPLPSWLSSLGANHFFLNETTAWFSIQNSDGASSSIYHTQNSGESWTVTPIPFNNARYFFVNAITGYALVSLDAGAGSHYIAIYQTVDSGASWTEVFTHEPAESKSLPEGGSKSGLAFLDLNQGWVTGNNPMTDYFYLFTTVDGGSTWAHQTNISLPAAYAGSFLGTYPPFFISNTVAFLPVHALTVENDMPLLLYRTNDGGQSWSFQSAIPDGEIVDFTTVDTGWVCSETTLLKTTDGGVTWAAPAMSGIPTTDTILKMDFVDDLNGWILTTPDAATWTPLRFFHTTDGGATWTQLLP